MRVATDIQPALWILERLHPFGLDVGAVIPEGFEAYARIFHPQYRRTATGDLVPVRWHEIAAANNRSITEEMMRLNSAGDPTQFSPSGESLWDQQSPVGSLPREIAERLVTTLSACTQTSKKCWFAVWEGWAGLRVRQDNAPRLSIPFRNLFLFEGAIEDALITFDSQRWRYQSANLWWPEDRAWCVATEIDFKWTYVGGSFRCIEALLRDPLLEVLSTTPTQGHAMEK